MNEQIDEKKEFLKSYFTGLNDDDFSQEVGEFFLTCLEQRRSFVALGILELIKQAVFVDIKNDFENKKD